MIQIPWELIGKLYEDIKNMIVAKGKVGGEAAIGNAGRVFTDTSNGFTISWPDGWIPDTFTGQTILRAMGIPATTTCPILILAEQLVDGFRPSINVTVEVTGDITIQSYAEYTRRTLELRGMEVLDSHVDVHSDSATLKITQIAPSGHHLFQVQKLTMARRRALVLTVSELAPQLMTDHPSLVDDIKTILRSFRLLEIPQQSKL